MSEYKCLIWGTEAVYEIRTTDEYRLTSARAGGEYSVTGPVGTSLQSLSDQQKAKVTYWLVSQRRLGDLSPKIDTDALLAIEGHRFPSVQERVENFLRFLESKTEFIGDVITFIIPFRDQTLLHELQAWTASRQAPEVITLCEYCASRGWIDYRSSDTGMSLKHDMMLRPPAYSYLADLDGANKSSSLCFVAMWFDDSVKEACDLGIFPAVEEDCGYTALRIDKTEHNNKIDDEIIASIRRSRFVVADFTQGEGGARGGVYYEAGFAHGLNIPVIFTCRKDVIDKIHFDTRQYNHIAWESPNDLRKQLASRISATVGDGPKRR